MAGLTYTTYLNSVLNLAPTLSSDAAFMTDLPNVIDDASLRLYRELDLIDASVRDSANTMALSTRNFTFPNTYGRFVVVDELNVITPAGTTNPESGTRNQLIPASEEMLNALWPSSTGSTVPQYFSLVNQDLAIVGPWPAAAYTVEVVGTIHPEPISTTVATSILSVYFPDLLIAASMARISAYQKNYGAVVDDPKQGVTWESHLQMLLKSAATEESRKKFTSQGWSSKEPAPDATPPRT